MDNIETRTKPMDEAIKFLEQGPAGIFCEFQPGNGTRYLIGLTKLGDYPKTRRGAGGLLSGGWVVTWINKGSGGRCCVLQPEGFLAPGFLKEKLGGSIADAVVLSRLIARLTLREVDAWEPWKE